MKTALIPQTVGPHRITGKLRVRLSVERQKRVDDDFKYVRSKCGINQMCWLVQSTKLWSMRSLFVSSVYFLWVMHSIMLYPLCRQACKSE